MLFCWKPNAFREDLYSDELLNTEFEPLFKLSRAERLQLIEDLWDSIVHEDAELSVAEEKRAELCRRKERSLQHPSSGRTWERR
jgi:putative addiction module component (TIGR02574 family)